MPFRQLRALLVVVAVLGGVVLVGPTAKSGALDARPVGVASVVRPVGAVLAVRAVGAEPAAESGEGWLVPVAAPVVDPFRPPATRYSAGNRGIEYGTAVGDPVRAVDDGRVVWAGVVGSARHITVDHGNGLRSTSAYVASIGVVRGQDVKRGEVIGTAGADFHLTARLGDTYVDPALLFAGATVVLALADDGSQLAPPERLTARTWGGGDVWFVLERVHRAVDLTEVIDWGIEAGRRWYGQECISGGGAAAGGSGSPTDTGAREGAGSGSGADVAATTSESSSDDRVLIQVAGLGSSSGDGSIGSLDTEALGYQSGDVVGFSYAGGCTPEPFGSEGASPGGAASASETLTAQLESHPYDAVDTYADVDIAAARLADLIEAAAAARPGQPIDVVAHSLGGVVARRALEMLGDRPGGVLPATVVTIGSPHAGADLADAAIGVSPGSVLGDALDGVDRIADVWDAVSVSQVASSGPAALDPPGPPPDGVRVVSIGGASDLIVPLSSTYWEGAVNVAIETSLVDAASVHSDLPGLDAVTAEVAAALSGESGACQSLASTIQGVATSAVIQRAEDILGAGVAILSAL